MAIILAVGVITAINAVTIAVLIDAITSQGPGLSENATSVLTSAFTGTFGLLGGYLGWRAGTGKNGGNPEPPP